MVLAIRRARHMMADVSLGTRGIPYIAVDPLLVTLSDSLPGREASAGPHLDDHGCDTQQMKYAGAWHLERSLTLRSPTDHPQWPPHLRAAVAARVPKIGMTREMLAYVWGFPPIFGTRDYLDGLSDWDYEPPNGRALFRDGRVTSLVMPMQHP